MNHDFIQRSCGGHLASAMSWSHKLRQAWRLLDARALRVRRSRCPLCGWPVLVQLNSTELGLRCPWCGASAITQSLVAALTDDLPDLGRLAVYEASARGPLVAWLARKSGSLVTSEFFEDGEPGNERNGVRIEDLQSLSFEDNCFDLVTSTEVLEHVPDDAAAFREILRVLKPGGRTYFTVPLTGLSTTIERVRLEEGRQVYLQPVEFHADAYRGAKVLCFRNYGDDITMRLRDAGFTSCEIVQPTLALAGHARPVIRARKPPVQSK